MVITLENVVEKLNTDYVIIQSFVFSKKSKKQWKLFNKIQIELSDGSKIIIPAGFYFNLNLHFLNCGLIGILIHKYLYKHNNKHKLSRSQSDKEMLIWLKATNKNWLHNYIRYIFVRLFGWLWWKKSKSCQNKLMVQRTY